MPITSDEARELGELNQRVRVLEDRIAEQSEHQLANAHTRMMVFAVTGAALVAAVTAIVIALLAGQ